VIRVGVFALLLVGKTGRVIGVPLYLPLETSLEVQPEHRGRLLRFRFRRWLGRFSEPGGGSAEETFRSN
jgi:hypothetical protein